MDNVNHLLEGASPYQVLQDQAGKLSSKWEKSGLLEGIESSAEKNNMAILLENQAKQLVNEASSTGTGNAISTTGNSEAWAGVALPLVRRVFGEIVAKDLVSVQPMNLPAGLIFYLDFQYGTGQPGFTSGDSLYAATSDLKKTDLPAAGARKGLYGAGTFGYSINEFEATVFVSGSTSDDNAFVTQETADSASLGRLAANATSSAVAGGINFNEEFLNASGGANGATTNVKVLRFPVASLTDPDLEAVRAFSLKAAGGASSITNFNEFNRVTADGAHVDIYFKGTVTDKSAVTLQFVKGPNNLDDRGDFEEGKTGVSDFGSGGTVSNMDIPEINVALRSDTVAAKTRKLKAQWTPEFAQDLNAYHSIDAEAELTSILSEYISMEIDLEILDMLIRNADTTSHWSAKITEEVNDDGATTTAAGTAGTYYTKMSWFQTLGVKLQKVSNIIHQKTLRGGANFLVVSPKVSTVLESIPGFAADSAGDSNKYNMGVQKIGAINNRYTVYKNPYITENVILMGYKGSQFLETGAVFAPYIPLIMTPLVYDPSSFTPRKGIMTRYAKKMVRPDFYGKVILHHLDEV